MNLLTPKQIPCPTCGGSGTPGKVWVYDGMDSILCTCLDCYGSGTVTEPLSDTLERVTKIARELANGMEIAYCHDQQGYDDCRDCKGYPSESEQCIAARIQAAAEAVERKS
jgi:hypothetical protein